MYLFAHLPTHFLIVHPHIHMHSLTGDEILALLKSMAELPLTTIGPGFDSWILLRKVMQCMTFMTTVTNIYPFPLLLVVHSLEFQKSFSKFLSGKHLKYFPSVAVSIKNLCTRDFMPSQLFIYFILPGIICIVVFNKGFNSEIVPYFFGEKKDC